MAFLPASRPYTPADHVANACLSLYHPLDAKYKPRVRSNGLREWTVLAGIVLSTKGKEKATSEDDDSYACVSLTSGVKVLSERALPVFGDALHDSHAEILARRGFLVFLVNEARKVLCGAPSAWVEREGMTSTVRLKQGINVHLYVSTLPCGDASTLYTALSQPADMASLKAGDNAAGVPVPDQASSTARGRSGYGVYGSLRTKPGRADSIPSTSHSCSDKIATWSVLGLQGALLAQLFPNPIYLSSIVIGDIPRSPPDEVDMARCDVRETGWQEIMRSECERAFSGRLASIESHLPRPYRLHRPRINFTALCFPYGRWQVAPTSVDSPYPPAPAVTDMRGLLYVPGYMSAPEPINNGCKGNAVCKLDRTEPIHPRYRSSACRLELFRAVEELVQGGSLEAESPATYHEVKHRAGASTYQHAKTILRTDTGTDITPPFQGWLISGKRWGTFDLQGSCSHL